MMANAAKKLIETRMLAAHDPATLPGRLKRIGGSKSDDWNNVVINQAVDALWLNKHSDTKAHDKQCEAVVAAMIGIAPQDELEGMIAAQLVACHNASMECYRRAMIDPQSFEGRHENLKQANKLSRTYATLLETLNRHRGKGAQRVTVEHVHVHKGGQAVVGNLERRGGGFTPKSEEQPHALAYAPGTAMPSTDTPRKPLPVAGNEERPLPDARRNVTGRPKR
jgi:hypothetical protein